MGNLVLAGSSSGSTTITPASTGTYTITLPAETGTIQTSGAGFTTNGVAYASSTSALTTGSALKFDGTNLGVGTTPPTWFNDYRVIQIAGSASLSGRVTASGNMQLMVNTYRDASANYIYSSTGAAGQYFMTDNQHIWYNAPSGTAGNAITWTQAMTLDASGNLLVGTTSLSGGKINVVNSSGLWVQKLQDAASNGSMIQFLTPAGSQAGSITISGSTTTYGSGSDYRLKEQIKPLENSLFKVNLLKPVSWVWKTEQTNGQGFIAHELAEIVPDCVVGEKDAIDENGDIKPQMVDTSFLVATLTAAIQELNTLITAQQSTITSLTERITALEGART